MIADRVVAAFLVVGVAALAMSGAARAETWRGLTVAPEHRCSPYDRNRDYRYPQSVEQEIVRRLGAVYGPYTGTCFADASETDIEHIVAVSEAHDSGLCAAGRDVRKRFAKDLRNLTLASPRLNRNIKSAKDAGEWLPDRNRCWFAARVVEVRRAYGLTIDRREADALERILDGCASTEMEPVVCRVPIASNREQGTGPVPDGAGDVLARYDDNGNGRITCKEARRHGIAPVGSDHPAYRFMHDGDGDGVVCETAGDREQGSGPLPDGASDVLARYDDNGNGRITCKEARRHGIAPVGSDHPAYRYMNDGDGDGVVCE